MNPVLEIDGLTVALPGGGDRPNAIERASWSIEAGKVLCVVGESGSGKSVAAGAILGLLPRELSVVDGAIRLSGTDLLREGPEAMRRHRGRDIGMIFQEPMSALNPIMPIGRQLTETLAAHGFTDRRANRARALEWLKRVGLQDAERIYSAYPFRLSGGQRQRVMTAMALILGPRLLIADEPTTALDVTTQKEVLHQIDTLRREEKLAILFITHDFGVVSEIADDVVVMKKGVVVEQGTRDEVLLNPRHPYTKRLIDAVPRPAPASREDAPAGGEEPLLAIRSLTKTFHLRLSPLSPVRAFTALDDIHLDIKRGETLGVVGESGSGKSTLARCLLRLQSPDSGEILFKGQDLCRIPLARYGPFRSKIQMVFQDPYASLNPRRKVGDIVCQGLIAKGVERKAALARATELLRLVHLDESSLERYPHEFSGGQRQRIGIARALALEPEILVADEAVSALDVSVQAEVLRLLADIQQRLGLTLVFITHDLLVAAKICDRVAVMQKGRLVEVGSATQVLQHPSQQYTRDLVEAVPGRDWIFGRLAPGRQPDRGHQIS